MAQLMTMNCTQSGVLRGAQLSVRKPVQARPCAPVAVSARYRGKGTDMSAVPAFQKNENDTGSAGAQIARLSARVLQLTAHLQEHKKDFSTRRGLMAILSQRKQMMIYLQRTNPQEYERCLAELKIRPLKAEAAR